MCLIQRENLKSKIKICTLVFLLKCTAYITEKCEDRLLHLLAGLPTSSFQSPAFAFMRHTGPQRSNLESRQTVLRNRASNRGPLLIRAS